VAGVVGWLECSSGEGWRESVVSCVCVWLFVCGSERDCSVCVVPTQAGATALLIACRNGHLEVARWLVSSAGSNAATERDSVRMMLWVVVSALYNVSPRQHGR
jgi:hypothetical protein